ncbi:MAG: hypothetical protein HC917_17445 [Richelia sp. SM2_1_7]|nr:hypothetical protein [Richelia sp. SM2_1_7]
MKISGDDYGNQDRFFGKSKKQPDDNDNPPTTDIQLSPAIETSSEANKGFFPQIWNKFRKHSHSEQTTAPDMELATKEVETTTNKQSDIKSKLNHLYRMFSKKMMMFPLN